MDVTLSQAVERLEVLEERITGLTQQAEAQRRRIVALESDRDRLLTQVDQLVATLQQVALDAEESIDKVRQTLTESMSNFGQTLKILTQHNQAVDRRLDGPSAN